MKVHLLMQDYGHDESYVLGVFRSSSKAKAQASIGAVAAQHELDRHNRECVRMEKPHWQMDTSLYRHYVVARELVE